jgi:hypothetical protein
MAVRAGLRAYNMGNMLGGKPSASPGPQGGWSSTPSISMDCRQDNHEACIHANCDCCHDQQILIGDRWLPRHQHHIPGHGSVTCFRDDCDVYAIQRAAYQLS